MLEVGTHWDKKDGGYHHCKYDSVPSQLNWIVFVCEQTDT